MARDLGDLQDLLFTNPKAKATRRQRQLVTNVTWGEGPRLLPVIGLLHVLDGLARDLGDLQDLFITNPKVKAATPP